MHHVTFTILLGFFLLVFRVVWSVLQLVASSPVDCRCICAGTSNAYNMDVRILYKEGIDNVTFCSCKNFLMTRSAYEPSPANFISPDDLCAKCVCQRHSSLDENDFARLFTTVAVVLLMSSLLYFVLQILWRLLSLSWDTNNNNKHQGDDLAEHETIEWVLDYLPSKLRKDLKKDYIRIDDDAAAV